MAVYGSPEAITKSLLKPGNCFVERELLGLLNIKLGLLLVNTKIPALRDRHWNSSCCVTSLQAKVVIDVRGFPQADAGEGS